MNINPRTNPRIIPLYLILVAIVVVAVFYTAYTAVKQDAELDGLNILVWLEFSPFFNNSTDFPEVGLNLTIATTYEELEHHLKSASFDLVIAPNYLVKTLFDAGLITTTGYDAFINKDELLNLSIEPETPFDFDISIPYYVECYGIGFNARAISRYPEKWMDLFVETDDSKIMLPDNMRDTIGCALMAEGFSPNSSNREEIEQAGQLLEQAIPFTVFDTADVGIQHLLKSKQIELCFARSSHFTDIDDDKHDFRFIIPEQPTVLRVYHLAIPSNSSDLEASRMALDYLMVPKTVAEGSELTRFGVLFRSARKHVDRRLLNGPAYFIPTPDMILTYEHLAPEVEEIYNTVWTAYRDKLLVYLKDNNSK
jgi:spermidine/putrescine transport system substrate-binding protein